MMFDEVYKDYEAKCKGLGLKPSSKLELFGEEIEIKEDLQSIEELSRARKQEPPSLSESAKNIIDTQTISSVSKKRKRREKSTRVLQTQDEKRLKRNAQSMKQYYKKRDLS